jgi:signal transduction histidine kinase
MVPYRGRLALRIARTVLAGACLIWFLHGAGLHLTWILALLGAYVMFALGVQLESDFDTPLRAAVCTAADAAHFGLWAWMAPDSWPPLLACGYLMAATTIQQDLVRALGAAAVAVAVALLAPDGGPRTLVYGAVAMAGIAAALAFYKRYLEERTSATLRNNVIIRSQAQLAREAERQRIAADFHDGPMQSFISFQMRLEIVRKLLARDVEAASTELSQLQELCRTQVADLRSFVRSMRPADEGMSLTASLGRMAELFQRDTGITAEFSAEDVADPGETEVSLEVLQIVRETLNNIQKHSGATRVAISASRRGQRLEIVVQDNGSGFPFAGEFTLEELELLRLGPVSVKRRVRMLGGELGIQSRPGEGAKLEIRVPV